MTMVLIIVVASIMVLGFLIATGSNKNINSRTEHEADLLEKHFQEDLSLEKKKKKKSPKKKKKEVGSQGKIDYI
jgi:hypothetical protein